MFEEPKGPCLKNCKQLHKQADIMNFKVNF